MSFPEVQLSDLLIPLEDIKSATGRFSPRNLIWEFGAGKYYKGQLSHRLHNGPAFFKCIDLECTLEDLEKFEKMSIFHHENHENIIRFIGYCNAPGKTITVFEYPINGSLHQHLVDDKKRRKLTWAQRLKICVGVATGLKHLYSHSWKGMIAVHGDLSSMTISLHEEMKPKIAGLESIELVSKDPQKLNKNFAFTGNNRDPTCLETSSITPESGIYSFGMFLFEMISGRLCSEEKSLNNIKKAPLITWIRYFQEVGLDTLMDPDIRDQIDRRSFHLVKEIACKCISFNIKERPTIDMIMDTIGKARDICDPGTASIVNIQSHQLQNPTDLKISLKEIRKATRNFSKEDSIKRCLFGNVYRGKFSVHKENFTAVKRHRANSLMEKNEFLNELEMMSSFQHRNIIPFRGYCEERGELIILSAYATKGSLDLYLSDRNKRESLTWEQRLEICLGAARGLKYLHSGLGDRGKVIHGDFKSAKILLDDNMEAKLCGFCSSILLPKNQPQVFRSVETTKGYTDPVYEESKIVKIETDTYSFGVVMFELLSGMLAAKTVVFEEYYEMALHKFGDDQPQTLMHMVRKYYNAEPDKLLDPYIKEKVNRPSLDTFREIAYKCVSVNLKDRPSMNSIIKEIQKALEFQNHGAASTMPSHQNQNLKGSLIPREEIDEVTKKSEQVSYGGSCSVYKGQLSKSGKDCMVAIKIIKPETPESKEKHSKEFHNELELIFRLQHQNIIPLIGYCDEGGAMIIITKYAENGSLDNYLQDEKKRKRLTWKQRLTICLGAANGLHYLHSGCGMDMNIVHGDVKSGNILLDDTLNAKICDFGLSKSGSAYQGGTGAFTNIVGTDYYRDPKYHESCYLASASDVYSYGVVLFEMLCGFLAYETRKNLEEAEDKKQYLISLVRRYQAKGLYELIDEYIKEEIDDYSYNTFIDLAYACIDLVSIRPTMNYVIDRIEEALNYHQKHQEARSKQKKRKASSDPDKQKLNVVVLEVEKV